MNTIFDSLSFYAEPPNGMMFHRNGEFYITIRAFVLKLHQIDMAYGMATSTICYMMKFIQWKLVQWCFCCKFRLVNESYEYS